MEAGITSYDADAQAPEWVVAPTYRELEALVVRLEAVVAVQAARIVELEARLGKNSRNSSKPPSGDGPARPRRTRREPSGRRPGKQPGAPGAHLARVAQPDVVVVHAPERCAGCGGGLTDAEVVGAEARQVLDLPPLRLRATEHRAQRRRCPDPGCGVVTTGAFPEAVRAGVQYGPGLRATVAYLTVWQHLPVDRTAQLLSDCFGASVATGTISAIVAEGAGRLDGPGGFLEVVGAQLAGAQVAHFDETGCRVAGVGHWVHGASTRALSLFTIHPKRGQVGMDAAGVLPRFRGVAVHDGWAPYDGYRQATHARCNAHHLRELQGITDADPTGQGWAAGMAELLVDAKRAVDRARAAGATALDPGLLDRLERRYRALIGAGRDANPAPVRARGQRGRVAKSPAANLLDRLAGHHDEVLRFLADFRVPFDNNQAERDIRMVKLQHKISGGWRSLAGAAAFLALRSYVATARKQGVNVSQVLGQVFVGQPWLPGPPTPAPP